MESSVAWSNGTYRDYMKKLKKEKLLIQDEWLLYPLKEAEARDVLELAEARNKVVSTIFCSQYDTSEWHETLYAPTLADAICDRIHLQRPIPSKSWVSPCASVRAFRNNSPHGGPLHHTRGRHAPFRRNGCTIVPVSDRRRRCLFYAVRV